jgi:hypothetical protein
MPSSPGYTRDYKQEDATAKARGEMSSGHDGGHAKRQRDRRKALKLGMVHPGQDLDHKTPLSKGGTETPANWRARTPHENRSYPRNSDGSMIANHPKTK